MHTRGARADRTGRTGQMPRACVGGSRMGQAGGSVRGLTRRGRRQGGRWRVTRGADQAPGQALKGSWEGHPEAGGRAGCANTV